MRKWIIAAIAVIVLAGCASKGTQEAAPVEDKGGATTTAPGATTSGAGGAGVGGTPTASAQPAHRDPANVLYQKRSIYFDFDDYAVKDQYRPIIEAHAKYLQGNRTLRITLQGNTDERGTREYNIALGQRRADAVKKLMLLLGATDVQIETVSFGKEKPRREGHDETSWAENRRVDIVYAGE
ncbi:MAG TPA: peptidoglycan-associated lipoprotein Pal [Casimicrobiaceae bacterium]|jgi:peptidoglycan-associated lipoprotein|nr:peptidoglycan-associated lipoprotein Pal [Casimicrobiaceae bacterium]